MTVVRVATDSSVPTSTEADAGSSHELYCRASTNTLSAGGSAAISTAALTQFGSNGPNAVSSSSATSGCRTSLTSTSTGTSHGTPFNRRNATVTPRVNSAQGADALDRNCSKRSIDAGGSIRNAADSAPSALATISGCSAILRTTSSASAPAPLPCGRASAIRNGTIEKNSRVSKQKISATGAAACAPTVARASPGPM